MKLISPLLPKKQKGAVLAISLIILLLMTMIGVSAMQSTTLQEKMAGNLRDANLAFQAAESGLRDAESYLFKIATLPSFTASCGNGFCLPALPSGTPQWKMKNTSNVSYWNDSTKLRNYGTGTGAADLPNVSRQPQTMIEEIVVPSIDLSEPTMRYRVTSQGYGAASTTESGTVRPHARVMLQSIIRR